MTELAAGTRDPKQRLTRRCDLCGQIDDHPRIIHYADDGTVVEAHHDCAAEQGIGKAAAIVEAAGNKQGDALVKFLTSGGADHHATANAEDLGIVPGSEA